MKYYIKLLLLVPFWFCSCCNAETIETATHTRDLFQIQNQFYNGSRNFFLPKDLKSNSNSNPYPLLDFANYNSAKNGKEINTFRLLKGVMPESVVQIYMEDHLSKEGNWKSVSSRAKSGDAGIDHIFIEVDDLGRPKKLKLGETKTNNSGLTYYDKSKTLQMSKKWKDERLSALSEVYKEIADKPDINITRAKMPNRPDVVELNVFVSKDKKVKFWKDKTNKIFYDGPEKEFSKAKINASEYSNYYDQIVKGKLKYDSEVYSVKINYEENKIQIIKYDVKDIDSKSIHNINRNKYYYDSNGHSKTEIGQLSKKEFHKIAEKANSGLEIRNSDYTGRIAQNTKTNLNNYSDAELLRLAESATFETNNQFQTNYKKTALDIDLKKSLYNGKEIALSTGIAIGIDLLFQFSFNDKIDYSQTIIAGASSYGGMLAGNATNRIITDKVIDKYIKNQDLSFLTKYTSKAKTVAAISSSLATSLIYNGAMYSLGKYDTKTFAIELTTDVISDGIIYVVSSNLGLVGGPVGWIVSFTGSMAIKNVVGYYFRHKDEVQSNEEIKARIKKLKNTTKEAGY